MLISDGLDFFFAAESGARKLVEFLQAMVPIQSKTAKKLISHDSNSNTYNYKYTTSVEVVPICKDNIVCLPKGLAHSLGGIGRVCVVHKVTSLLHLIDPNTCQCKYSIELIHILRWNGGLMLRLFLKISLHPE